ncbi:hypothetical protein FRC00_000985 [Tulasnella sp. 408]|nr:hypothetical protein FRC00_000985 [Tulasnella sp. 408]
MLQRVRKSTVCTRSSSAPKRKRDNEEGEPARYTDRREAKRPQRDVYPARQLDSKAIQLPEHTRILTGGNDAVRQINVPEGRVSVKGPRCSRTMNETAVPEVSSSEVGLASSTGVEPGAAKRHYDSGEAYLLQEKYIEAAKAFEEARKCYSVIGDKPGQADASYWLGEAYRAQNKFSKAEKAFFRARKIYGTQFIEPGRAKASYWLGHVYREQSNSKDAAEAFEQARDAFERTKNKRGVADASYWLGFVHKLRKNFDLAKESFILAKTEYTGIGNQLDQADTLYQLAEVESSRYQYDEAEGFLDEASNIFVHLNHEEGRKKVAFLRGQINISRLQRVQRQAKSNLSSSLGASNSNGEVSGEQGALGDPVEHGGVQVERETPVDPHVKTAEGDSRELGSPPVSDIGPLITWINMEPSSRGGFGDVLEGTHSVIGRVALKRLRNSSERAVIRRFEREAAVWSGLRHVHVLKLLGTLHKNGEFYLVSPFQINGSLMRFVANHPQVNRIKLLREAADGLTYLHEQKIIHGDIKGDNILISNLRTALVCDFGLSKMGDSKTSTGMKGAGSSFWMSPEVLLEQPKSFKSDVYSFGMTIAEVSTG